MTKKQGNEELQQNIQETVRFWKIKEGKKQKEKLYTGKRKNRKSNTEPQSPSNTAYKTNNSKGKAFARVKQSFPKSPQKKRAAVKQLAWEQIKIKPFTSIKTRKSATEVRNSLLSFFNWDDISK